MTDEELIMFYERRWEASKKRMHPLLRGSLFGLAIVGPFWLAFIWLCVR